jgi:hypothetical protein
MVKCRSCDSPLWDGPCTCAHWCKSRVCKNPYNATGVAIADARFREWVADATLDTQYDSQWRPSSAVIDRPEWSRTPPPRYNMGRPPNGEERRYGNSRTDWYMAAHQRYADYIEARDEGTYPPQYTARSLAEPDIGFLDLTQLNNLQPFEPDEEGQD